MDIGIGVVVGVVGVMVVQVFMVVGVVLEGVNPFLVCV